MTMTMTMNTKIRAVVVPAEMASGGIMPGLFDVYSSDGREWRDLTYYALRHLIVYEGFEEIRYEAAT